MRVLVALRLGYSSTRRFLAGVARYLRHTPSWRVTVAENFYDFDAATLAKAARDSYDSMPSWIFISQSGVLTTRKLDLAMMEISSLSA